MPEGLVRNGDYRNGTPITEPKDFGNEVTWTPDPAHFGNPVTWTPDPAHFGNAVTWLPDPAHFGNPIGPSQQTTPTFDPPAGTYTEAQTVTITSAGADTIYYTTDGSTPTTSSTVYSDPITVGSSETVKALAVKAGLADSDVGSAAYTIEVTAPTLIAHTGANDNAGGSATITTPMIDTTGANLLIAFVSQWSNDASTTITDTYDNTWIPLGLLPGFSGNTRILYSWNATVGTGHAFTSTNDGNNGLGFSIMAFSGIQSSSDPLVVGTDLQDHVDPGPTLQTSSVNPSSGDLIVTCIGQYAAFSTPSDFTIDSGFTIPDTLGLGVGSASVSEAAAYFIGDGTAVAPTWTSIAGSTTNRMTDSIAAFAHA